MRVAPPASLCGFPAGTWEGIGRDSTEHIATSQVESHGRPGAGTPTGRAFADLQTRDMTYTVKAPDARSLEFQVTSTAKSGRYRITTDYLTDPARNTLLMRIAFEPQEGDNANYHVYLRYDPSIN